MPTYVTPGVSFERADANATTIAPLRTDVCAFVGIARRGPVDAPVAVESWRQFLAAFGDFTGAGYLAYAVRAFFENGGERCVVVRVASPAAATASTTLQLTAGGDAWRVRASGPGVWGNDVDVEWRETHRAQTLVDADAPVVPEFATVRSVAGFARGTFVRVLVAPGAPAYRVVTDVDATRRRLYWVNPRPPRRLAYESPLAGYDPSHVVIESVEYTLLVRELGRLVGVYERLSPSPSDARYGPSVLAGRTGATATASAPPEPLAIEELRAPVTLASLRPLASTSLVRRALAGGLDGLAPLTTYDFVGEPIDPLDDAFVRARKTRGLRALDAVGEVALVAIPDIHIQPAEAPRKQPPPACVPDPCLPPPPAPPATPRVASVGDLPPRFTLTQIEVVQQALLEHCRAAHDRFALLDPPFETARDARQGVGPLRAWRKRFDSDFGALYAPWLVVPDPLRLDASGLRAVPPSGHVAGFVAQTDLREGVHRAPANGALAWAQSTTLPIDDAVHGVLNPEHVNAIRAFPGRGLRVFGARTLSSDPDWRFVNVRRLVLMLEKAIRIGTQWATFEPNDRVTRAKLLLALTSLLLEVWRRGALAGATAEEAFYVNCGEAENPPDARARGRLVAEVGLAPAKPFEFVVVRIGVTDDALEITESGRDDARFAEAAP